MVHYDDKYVQGSQSLARFFRRLIGLACLIAVPGIWIAVHGALPEARLVGLSLSVILIGVAGLCLIEPRR